MGQGRHPATCMDAHLSATEGYRGRGRGEGGGEERGREHTIGTSVWVESESCEGCQVLRRERNKNFGVPAHSLGSQHKTRQGPSRLASGTTFSAAIMIKI